MGRGQPERDLNLAGLGCLARWLARYGGPPQLSGPEVAILFVAAIAGIPRLTSIYLITWVATLGDKCSELLAESAPAWVWRQLDGATMLWSPGRAACLRGRGAITGVSCVIVMLNIMNVI